MANHTIIMKQILLILLLFVGFVSQAQTIFPYFSAPAYIATGNASYTVGINDVIIDLTSASNQTITLPTASTATNRMLIFINNVAQAKVISTYTDIVGTTSTVIPGLNSLYIVSNGTIWKQVTRSFTDAGTKTIPGNLVLAGTAGNTVTIGNTTGFVQINSGTAQMDIGSDATAQNANIMTGAGSKQLIIGSNTTTSSTTLRGGTNGITLSSTSSTGNAISLNGVSTTGNTVTLANTTQTTGTLINVTGTSTAKTAAARGIKVSTSGTNGAASLTTTSAEFTNTSTGTTATNVALTATASGGTNNYAALFTGNVGLGTSTPVHAISMGGVIGYIPVSLANQVANVTLTASSTVDVATAINIAQTTANVTITLPNMTTQTQVRTLLVNNTGSATFICNGSIIPAGGNETFTWNSGVGSWTAASANKTIFSFRAIRTSSLTINTGTTSDVTWNSATDNVGSGLNTGTGVFTAPQAGLYYFTSALRFEYNATPVQEQYMEIVASGGQTTRGGFALSGVVGNASSFYYANASSVYRLAANETVKVVVRQDTGGSLNLNGTQLCSFAGYYIPDRY
jgi:C1q domain